jgi:hypothetical protein
LFLVIQASQETRCSRRDSGFSFGFGFDDLAHTAEHGGDRGGQRQLASANEGVACARLASRPSFDVTHCDSPKLGLSYTHADTFPPHTADLLPAA